MPMGLAQKLQLTTSKYLVLFNSFLHNAKSKTQGINNFNSSSENSEEPDKNKSKWSDYLDKEMKQKFELAKNFMKTNKKANADIINKLLNSNISDSDLKNILNGPRIIFSDLSDKKLLIKIISKMGKDFDSL